MMNERKFIYRNAYLTLTTGNTYGISCMRIYFRSKNRISMVDEKGDWGGEADGE